MISKIYLQRLELPRFDLQLQDQIESYAKANSFKLVPLTLADVISLCGLTRTDLSYRVAYHTQSYLLGFLSSSKRDLMDFDYQVDAEFSSFVQVYKAKIQEYSKKILIAMEDKRIPACSEFILRKICLSKSLVVPKENFELLVDKHPQIVIEYLIAMRIDFTPVFEYGDKNVLLLDERFSERKYMFTDSIYSDKRKEDLYKLLDVKSIVPENFTFSKRVQLEHLFIFANLQEAFRYGVNTKFENVNHYEKRNFSSLIGNTTGEDYADLFFLFYGQRDKVRNASIRVFHTFDDLHRFCRETKSENMLLRMDLIKRYQSELPNLQRASFFFEKKRPFTYFTDRRLALSGTYFGIKVGFEDNFLIQSKILNEFYRSTKKGHPF